MIPSQILREWKRSFQSGPLSRFMSLETGSRKTGSLQKIVGVVQSINGLALCFQSLDGTARMRSGFVDHMSVYF